MRKNRQSIWANGVISFSLPILAGIGVIVVSVLLFSAVTTYVIGGMMFLKVFTTGAIILGGYISGYISGRYRRRRGLADGAAGGAVIYGILAIAGIFSGTFPGIMKLFILVTAGAVGGVAGVNTKRPKNLM